MHTLDTLRTYAPHEAGYWEAQRHAFTMIRRVEDALAARDSWAGRYTGYLDHTLEEMVVDDDCSDQYHAAHIYAVDLAADACLGNAYGIIIGQARLDETGQLIRNARDRDERRNSMSAG